MTTPSYRNYSGSAAETYERYFVPAIATPVSAALLDAAELRAGERVLDVACGTGVIALLAAERVGPTGWVAGVDLSAEMIDVAKSLETPTGSHIEWHVADAVSLPLPGTSVDVALCQMGLMFIEDPVAALTEMRRVLRRNGRAVVNTPGPIQPLFQIMEEAIVEHLGPELGGFVRRVFSIPDPDGLAALARSAGFAGVTVDVVPARLRLPGPADFLWQYINLTPMGPLVARANADVQEALERDVVRSWQPFVADGRLQVDQPMVVAKARG